MTSEIATAIKWVQKNINTYHGDESQVFVTGHSAGGIGSLGRVKSKV